MVHCYWSFTVYDKIIFFKNPVQTSGTVRIADDNVLQVLAKGDIEINVLIDGKEYSVGVKDVIYTSIEGVVNNMLSSLRVHFDRDGCNNDAIVRASLVDGM